jgi:hypothetical protein
MFQTQIYSSISQYFPLLESLVLEVAQKRISNGLQRAHTLGVRHLETTPIATSAKGPYSIRRQA